MRITQRTIADNNLRGMNASLAAIAKLNEQITSGKSLSRASDNPVGTATAMRTRGELTANDQYSANISQASTVLSAADSALGTMGEMLRRVRDLTVQAANTGAQNPQSMQALSAEVAGLEDGLLAMANRTINGRPVFGGTTSGAQAYAVIPPSTAATFAGRADVPQEVRVSGSEQVRTDIAGPTAFGADGTNVFDLVGRIAGEMTSTPTGDLTASLAAVDTALSRLTAARTEVGVRVDRLETVKTVNASASLALTSQLSDVEDIDQAKTYLELTVRQTGYQAALAASAQSIQTSLVDFIR